MNKITRRLLSFIKYLVAALAAANLVFLFVFNYRVPARLLALLPSSTEEETEALETEVLAALQIVVPSGSLSYDGSGDLDLSEGVYLLDASGTERSDIKIFTTIKAGSSLKEKIIEYSATAEDGTRVTAERPLTITGTYTGPTITVEGEMPELTEEELPGLVSTLVGEDLISADDGFGKDVTSSVTSAVKSTDEESGECIVTLNVTNMVSDSFSTDVTVQTQTSGPVLRLTTNSVTLNVGEEFSFYNYIAAAQDENGNSLYESISMNGSVDTSTPGEYVLEFYCVDGSGNSSPKKKLTVTVQ